MSDFDTASLLSDWNAVLTRAGTITALTGGVTFSGVWAEQADAFSDLNDQIRDEKRFTVFTTYTQLPTIPGVRQTILRSGITYVVSAVRSDAELVGIEFDVKRVI